ncbi:MAG: glycosyltransferase family 4 protein, partial [Alcaligenaceae bacterium]|nr:glycosyltransferase family 4 protein [Alcaligenaceae bacterium]
PDKGERLRLLAVGRLHPVKGFDLLIQAFAMVASYFPDWDLVIVGEGEERAALQKQIDTAALQHRIQLVGRVGNIKDWYEQSDMYVLSSRSEGLSNTLLEAMASGLAVVAMDCDTGPREIIRDNIDGVLVNPPADADALAAHLSDLMARPLKRVALARRAVDVRDRFSVPIVMAQWERLLPRVGRSTTTQKKP